MVSRFKAIASVGARIVTRSEVISAPVMREPIVNGQSQISGSFTTESANELAIQLRSGALPVDPAILAV